MVVWSFYIWKSSQGKKRRSERGRGEKMPLLKRKGQKEEK